MEASREWATRPADQRFKTLGELAAAVESRRMRSRAMDVDTKRTGIIDVGGELMINGTIQPARPTHWSFGQLSALVGAPAGYLRTLPNQLAIANLKHGLDTRPSETVKFMTVADPDGGPNTLQAVTSSTYGRIWDADVVAGVGRIVERSGGKFHNPLAYKGGTFGGETEPAGLYASDRDVFIFMIDGGSRLEAGPRAKLNRGFFAWNSETGARTFGLMTFLFNEVCGNNIVWGAEDVQTLLIRHTSGGPTRFDNEAMQTLRAYTEASAKPVEDTIKRAMALTLGKDDGEVSDFVLKHGKFTRGEIKSALDFARSEEGDARTLWNVVQGFTAYARGFEWVDARVDLEKRAGNLLNIVKDGSGKLA